MRKNIVHVGAGELTYEIRAIVRVGEELQRLGVPVRWENIGDPVAKGEPVPRWMKEIVADLALQDCSYAYCPTKGLQETREFLAERVNARGGAQVTPEDIVFFNGLGDAIQKVYGFLRREARVIGPSPAYTTHSSGEAAHAGQKPVCYRLDPDRGWMPDLQDLRLSVKYNPSVAGLLLLNPDNPTGAVYPPDVLEEMVAIAREFDLFVVADEIYANLVFDGVRTCQLADVIGDVPAISMKGISKELPWPGARCGWIEVYNAEKDPVFRRYVQSIVDAKMVEVCSTTLPQKAIPPILSHPEYPGHLAERRARYARYADLACEVLTSVPGVHVVRPNGAFYLTVRFLPGALTARQTLPVAQEPVRRLVERLVAEPGTSLDKRFVYYLLGAAGVCVVPLSSFATEEQGFRMTLLDPDEGRFRETLEILADAIGRYLASDPAVHPAARAAAG
ncbi:MAG: pyridoxal phosphate-dependent aminotransferase [Candidatus Dadabacteria bacterium]|nr:MAG: pyridoxal phosphate-dependent aminotransferase [Candidatus Dadabacteria bacterium]